MFFESITKILNKTFNIGEFDNFDNVNPGLVKYFRAEYGQDWKVALGHHLYKESLKNDKKAD